MNPLRRIALLIIAMSLAGVTPATTEAQEDKWAPEKTKESEFNGRKLDTFRHGFKKEGVTVAALSRHREKSFPGNQLTVVSSSTISGTIFCTNSFLRTVNGSAMLIDGLLVG